MGVEFGLVMTGGGARGAYQAGVLKRIGELYKGKPSPFPIIAGASAGAINSTMLAAGAEDFFQCTEHLSFLWESLTAERVFRTDLLSIGRQATHWMKDLSSGGLGGGARALGLLDASPLRRMLHESLPVDRIDYSIKNRYLKALAITATDYGSGKSFIFVQGSPGHAMYKKSRRLTIACNITIDHVCASAAIPIVFAPVLLETEYGKLYFGDGCLRLVTPLSPAVRLGAERILAIGVRNNKSADEGFVKAKESPNQKKVYSPPLARIIGVILNAIFLDHLDADIEHLKRMNDIIGSKGTTEGGLRGGGPLNPPLEPMKRIEILSISPSQDLGALALEYAHKMPGLVHYMMRGLGGANGESADLMSYLLFDKEYTQALIDVGYRDASARIDEIEAFLEPKK